MEDKLNKLPILKLKKASGKDTALKKRARYLLRREEVKNQKTRLECLLTQQFIHKYGSKTQQSKLNGAIILLIKQHLTNNDQMHSNTLAELELKIKQVTSAIKDEVRKKRNTRLSSEETSNVSHLQTQIDRIGDNKETNPFGRNETSTSINPRNWSIINAAMAINWDEMEKKKQEDLARKREKYKHDLELQRLGIQQQKEMEKNVDNKYVNQNRQEAMRREKEEKAKLENRRREMEKERQLRMHQIKEKEDARNHEKEINLLKELTDNARAQELIKQEEENKFILREAKRRAQVEAKLENDRIQERKLEMKRIESEADVKIIRESIARSLLEEKRRSQELQKRVKSSYENGSKFESQTIRTLDEAMRKEEERMMHEVENKVQMDHERDKVSRENRKKEAMKSLSINLQLIESKKILEEKDKENDKKLKLKYENDVIMMESERKLAMDERLVKARRTRESLDAQVSLKAQNKRYESLLSQREIALNKVYKEYFSSYNYRIA